jgi:hypothetical protein
VIWPKLEHWLEWGERCALGRCAEHTRDRLTSFARHRFALFLRVFSPLTSISRDEVEVPAGRDAWHLFETHAVARSLGTGKVFKRWIFGRMGKDPETWYDSVSSGATLILRNVVREYAVRELPRERTISLESQLDAGYEFASGDELLPSVPGVEAEVHLHDLDEIARTLEQEVFDLSTPRERIALVAKSTGISLDHPLVNKAAGCGRTALGETYRNYVLSIGGMLRNRYPDDEPETLMLLSMQLLERIKKITFLWFEAENVCPELSLYIEEHHAVES